MLINSSENKGILIKFDNYNNCCGNKGKNILCIVYGLG